MENKLTTVAIYREDLTELAKMCNKNEMFRDKLHMIIQKHLKESKQK